VLFVQTTKSADGRNPLKLLAVVIEDAPHGDVRIQQEKPNVAGGKPFRRSNGLETFYDEFGALLERIELLPSCSRRFSRGQRGLLNDKTSPCR